MPKSATRPGPARPGTRENILKAASAIFAEKGYSGANVSEIVARAQTTKPMIYYHFGNKTGLFSAVLEDVYAGMRQIELAVNTAGLPPAETMRRLVEATFDYHAAHPEWIRLISVANIHDAQHIRDSPTIASQNDAVIGVMQDVLARGEAQGVFRAGVDPLHLHLMIASMCFYRMSNQHTWKIIFKRDLTGEEDGRKLRAMLVDAVLCYLQPPDPAIPVTPAPG